MKKILLFVSIVALVMPLSAQRARRFMTGNPEVIVLGVSMPADVDVTSEVVRHFRETHVTGFQQSHIPNFIITSSSNRFMLGIGGYVNFRTAYDLGGAVDDLDFVPSAIPVPNSALTQQKLTMSASTSRLFFKAIANTKRFGRIVTYIETDFRGTPTGNLRLRKAYISMRGWLFGQNFTTFCDLNAAAPTVDFQGPNAYNLNFNTMIRYTHAFSDNWSIGVALEMPQLSATFGSYSTALKSVAQRCPDLPAYVKWSWYTSGGTNHLRLAGVVRNMTWYNTELEQSRNKLGWGFQLSGHMSFTRKLEMYMSGVYGKSISPYIQDITGLGYDLLPDPSRTDKLQTPVMWGWYGSLRYNMGDVAHISAGYSRVAVDTKFDYRPSAMYRYAEYIFANAFCNITPSCKVAVEYLYGRRKDYGGEHGKANRIQAMIQYNF